jgi:hypothetical protein
MKKSLALLLALALVFSSITVAFAEEATIGADAKAVTDIGMLVGDGKGVTPDYLTTTPSRIQAAVMFLRLKGLEAEAKAFTGEANFADADKAEWAKPIMAYLKAHPELGWIGDGTNFNPAEKVTAKQYYKVMLEALGYKQNTAEVVGDFTWDNVVEFAASKGLSKVASTTTFTVNDLAVGTVEALKANVKGAEKTLVATLVEAGKVDAAKAEADGLIVKATPVATSVKIKSAAAFTSKVVEVTLSEAATKVDATLFTVKDAAGTAVEVTAAELAAYSTANKTVLVTLKADTTVGTLYTITSGTTSANFGGKAADTTKPTVTSVASTDYNKVTVTFSEPVRLDGATIAMTEKYGAKAKLNATETKYGLNTEIVLTTDAQKASTLYGVVIENVVDFSGNKMDKDDAKTFVGQAMSTTVLEVVAAKANDYNQIAIDFNEKVDPATVVATAFKIEESYGTKATVAITEAKVAKKDDKDATGTKIVSDAVGAKTVILTVDGTMKASTLYKLTVTGVKTLYGKDMSTTVGKNTTTLVGTAKPTGTFAFAATPVTVNSNTEIVLNFERDIDTTIGATVANYAIAEAYGTKAALEIKAAEVDGNTVILTVAPLKTVLYKITVSNIKDIYGNAQKTTDSANVASFSGIAVAAKITKINSITRIDETHITVAFDQNVGTSAIDVAHYTIDNNVGYPEKAEVTANANEVKLTIPKTTEKKVYKLTVKGLENADGVAMATDGVSATFVGKGLTATAPELVAVVTADNQTLKIYFDRDVTDSMIDGASKIWDSSTGLLNGGVLKYVNNATPAGIDLFGATSYAVQDKENANVLVVRVSTNDAFKAANKIAATGAFKLIGKTTLFVENKNELQFAPNETEPTKLAIDAVMSVNKSTIRVYFNQPVYGTNMQNFAIVANSSKAPYTTLVNAIAVDSTKKIYDFKLATDLASTGTYWLIVDTALAAATLGESDVNAVVTLADEDDTVAGIQHSRQFAGSTAAASDIKDISVMMTDEKTIVVYYPEVMYRTGTGTNGTASASAVDFDNYKIVDKDGNAVTMSTGTFAVTDIGQIVYKTADNTVVITLNKTIKVPAGGVFLQIAKETANTTQTAFVKDGTNAIAAKQFAVSTTAGAKVTVSNAVYEEKVITVTLNQAVKTATDYVAIPADVVKALKITVKTETGDYVVLGTDIASILAEDRLGNNVANTSTTAATTVLKITLNNITGFKGGEVGKVEFVGTGVLTGINGNDVDTDSSVIFSH